MSWAGLMAVMDATLVEHFGGASVYTPAIGAAATPRGVFDAAYVPVSVGEAGVQSSGPAIFYRLADLPADPATDEPTITVNAVNYEVTVVRKDGQGGVLLELHRKV